MTSSTPADVINRYVEALLQSQNDADPLLVSGVNEEIEQSKKLISKLRRRLAGKGWHAVCGEWNLKIGDTPCSPFFWHASNSRSRRRQVDLRFRQWWRRCYGRRAQSPAWQPDKKVCRADTSLLWNRNACNCADVCCFYQRWPESHFHPPTPLLL